MRMNISVPDDLAERVRALELPISTICQQALRSAVEEADSQSAINADLDAVTKRLRGTVAEHEQHKRSEGRDDGTGWAKDYATAKELRLLAAEGRKGINPQSQTLLDFLSAQVNGHVISVDIDEDDIYWDGFLEGALAIWGAVASKLN